MRNKGQLVRRVFWGMLKEYGFELVDSHAGIVWSFSRNYETERQSVTLQKDLYTDALTMYIGTSAGKGFRIKDFYPDLDNDKEFPEDFKVHDLWDFADEGEFIRILEKFGKLVIEYGIDIMNANSTPTRESKCSLTEEMDEEFYKDHDMLCRKFMEKYPVSLENIDEGIEIVLKLLMERYEDDFKEVTLFLLEEASYLGCAFALKYKGVWTWKKFNSGSQVCDLTGKVGRRKKSYMPLHFLMHIWSHKITDLDISRGLLKRNLF